MDPSLRNQPPPAVNGEWQTIAELKTTATVRSWWDSFSKWMSVSMYEQIHKIELEEVWVEGELTSRTEPIWLAELEEMARAHKLPSVIAYKRRLYPKDYLRKAEVDDCVFFYLHESRVVYKPYIPDNDPTKLSYFYLQAYAFTFELLDCASLYEEVRNAGLESFASAPTSAASSELPRQGIRLKVLPFEDPNLHSVEKLQKVAAFYVRGLDKWDKSFRAGGYQKRVHHDVVVPLDLFTAHYRRLKVKYSHWVEEWEESTDPAKFVFEDVGIAAFLIAVWELENTPTKPTFIDIGCGNGFLVYILTMEGYSGRGIDLVKRKIWAKYPAEVKLSEEPIDPPTATFQEDWILANHSDELTPWVPFMASRNNRKFFVLPCCEWNFDCKFSKRTKQLSRYECYLEYIKVLTQQSGYKVEVEHLRIPSTRNIAVVGKIRTIDATNPAEVAGIEAQQAEALSKAKYSKFAPRTAPPKSHITKKKPAESERKPKFKGTLHPAHLAALAAAKESEQGEDGEVDETGETGAQDVASGVAMEVSEESVTSSENCACCAFEKP